MPDLQCDCGETPGEIALGGRGVVDAGTIPQGAAGGRSGDPAGALKSEEEEGPNPPGGVMPGPVPVFAYGPGPERCAEAGTAIASAAIIATPLKRCFISLVLRCSGLVRVADACMSAAKSQSAISNVLLCLGNALAPGYRPGLLFKSRRNLRAAMLGGGLDVFKLPPTAPSVHREVSLARDDPCLN